MEIARISRLQTLRKNCMVLGENPPEQANFTHITKMHSLFYMLIDKAHQVILQSPPKTGSTTWRFVFLNHTSSSSSIPPLTKKGPGVKLPAIHMQTIFLRSNSTLPAVRMDKSEVLKYIQTYFSILTTRHPFDRLESVFTDKVVIMNVASIRKNILLRRNITITEASRLTLNASSVKFEEFLEYIQHTYDPHWDSVYNHSMPCLIPYR